MQDEGRAPLIPEDPDSEPAAVVTAGRSRLYAVMGVTAALALGLDQGTKAWVLGHLTPGIPTDLIDGILTLELVRNPGAAFSIGTSITWLLVLIGILVLIWVLLSVRKVGSLGWALALGLLSGGAVGNLVDRFVRSPGPGRGQVVDFIDYGGLFVGNVADIAIVGAALLIVVLSVRGVTLSGGRVEAGGGRHASSSAGSAAAGQEAGRADGPADDDDHGRHR